ncbi:MAG TPA: hypothetical protein VHA07_03940 [Devosia sp.]|nr:hypothetical protein [Devosia sp.]
MNRIFAGVTLFCDDIREELTGMNTLVGIYPDNVVVNKMPFAFPKLAFYTRLTVPTDFEIEPITVNLLAGEEERQLATFTSELVSLAISQAKADGAEIAGMISRTVHAPFPVAAPTRLRIMAKTPNYECQIGNLNIREGSQSATSPKD